VSRTEPLRALALLATALAGAAVALAVLVDSSGEPWFAAGFALVFAWRLAFGRDGRALLPQRAVALLLVLLLAAGLPYLMDMAKAGGGTRFLEGVLGVLTCFLGATLLAPLGPFGAFWVVLLASTATAVSASLAQDPPAAVGLVTCVALVAWTLLVLERTVPAVQPDAGRRLVDPGSRAGAAWRSTALALAALGLTSGALLWLAAPRPAGSRGAEAERQTHHTVAGDADGSGSRGGTSGEAVTGPDDGPGDDAVLGAVDRIQQDPRVHLEARLVDGDEEPTLFLREAVRDLWVDAPGSSAARWRSSHALVRRRLVPDTDGTVVLRDPAADRPERTFDVTYRLGSRLVFLEPEALSFRLLEPADAELAPHHADAFRLGSERIERRIEPGDVVRGRSQPQRRGGLALEGRESSARVAPLTSYASIDAGVARRLRELSADVPRMDGADAIGRARALERWLQGPEFAYALSSPELAAGRRIEEFLGRVRRGNCEWYATALTLLLRAHGHAARYVQGYWAGSHTAGSRVWTFHGASYHAWTELYLDGVGWVPLNPTPPERMAALGGGPTVEAGRRDAGDAAKGRGTPLSERLRGWGSAAWTWVEDGLAGRHGPLGRWILPVLAAVLLALFVLGLKRRARAGSPGGGVPPDAEALAQALRLLARRGFPRPLAWTAREYVERTGKGLKPEALAALARIAARHEQRRYAGRPGEGAPDRDDLKALAAALAPTRPSA
jgi:transglutaminase-like putative cysteine protease